jgi:S-adenosylmethionine synthetase
VFVASVFVTLVFVTCAAPLSSARFPPQGAHVPLRQFTSESVTEGHPDKICDRISDSILDAMLEQDPGARVAVETLVTTGLVHVAGEVSTTGYVEIPQIVREAVRDIGYTSSEMGFDAASCGVSVSIGQQSPDIAGGVDSSLEVRSGEAGEDDGLSRQGAGDQGIMFGYATDETPELHPLPSWIAHRLAERLTEVRKSGVLPELRPDGKTQVTIGYDGNRAVSVEAVVVSTQHHGDISQQALRDAVEREVIRPVLERVELNSSDAQLFINPAGPFVIGGPMGDAGLTGRKIIIDTYGGASRHGGGAFSGKDPSKVDRSAAYAMRWVAKHVVRAGLARRAELQVAYAIGRAHPVGLYVETFGTETVPLDRIERAVREVFDLRPLAIIRDLELLRPVYAKTSAYGHFGRELPEFTWEATPRTAELRAAAGL